MNYNEAKSQKHYIKQRCQVQKRTNCIIPFILNCRTGKTNLP